jgi:hypothetical protein
MHIKKNEEVQNQEGKLFKNPIEWGLQFAFLEENDSCSLDK